MAIGIGNTSSNSGTDVSIASMSHTCTSNSDRILLVGLWTSTTSNGPVTYDGDSMTAVGWASHPSLGLIRIYYLVDPATGSNTVALGGGSGVNYISCALDLYSVDTSDPLYDDEYVNGNSTVISDTISTDNSNQLVVDFAAHMDATNMTQGAGQTSRKEETYISAWGGLSTEAADGGTITMSWTGADSSDIWGTVLLVINPLSGPSITIEGITPASVEDVSWANITDIA